MAKDCPCGKTATHFSDPISGRRIPGICRDCSEQAVRKSTLIPVAVGKAKSKKPKSGQYPRGMFH